MRSVTCLSCDWAFLVAQLVNNPPAMRETWVPSLGWVDPLEKGTATHSSILAWRIPRTGEPGRLQSSPMPHSSNPGSDKAEPFFLEEFTDPQGKEVTWTEL